PAGATQVHLQVIPFNNDGPGADLYLGSPATSFDIPAPPAWYGLLPDLTYTVRVQVSDASSGVALNDPSWSTPAQRQFRTPKVDSNGITAVSPAAGGTVSTLTPMLQWANPRADVFYYEVQVSKDSSFNTNPATASAMVYWELRHGGVTNPMDSYTVPSSFPLENNTSYFWRVRPRVQGDGTPVAWSSPFTFSTRQTSPSPSPLPSPSPSGGPAPTSGDRIAFVSDRGGGLNDIWVVRPDG